MNASEARETVKRVRDTGYSDMEDVERVLVAITYAARTGRRGVYVQKGARSTAKYLELMGYTVKETSPESWTISWEDSDERK